MEPRSAFSSIVTCKCPRCREGIVFIHKNPYHPKFSQIHEKCDQCELVYEMEQGFWYGAMYVSYALGVAMAVPTVLLLTIFTELSIFEITGVIFGMLVLTMPLLFRYSRSVWLHIFIRFDKQKFAKLKG